LIEFYGLVSEGGKMDCSEAIRNALRSFAGKIVKVTLAESRTKRSLSQNSYYWAVVIPRVMEVLDYYGNEADRDLSHEFVKRKFLPTEGRKFVEIDRDHYELRSTTWLGTSNFEDYLTKIRVWLGEQGFPCPLPNEYSSEV
jgi:hypothetical protein